MDVQVLETVQFDGYTRQKIIFNSDAFSSVPAYVLFPKSTRRRRFPAVLCAHGHPIGKDGVVGLIDDYQKQFAVELAKQGFVTLAPDWRTMGERADRDEWVQRIKRDGCNVAHMAFGYFGYHLLQLDICDAQRCLDYLQVREDVDRSRIACMGCSFGGTMTTFLTALDRRVKAAVIVCYLNTLTDALGERNRANACGSQFLSGLRTYGDISDVAGLIAPRPCLVQIGAQDHTFIEADAKVAYAHLKTIYDAAGRPDHLEQDCFPGGHEVNVPTAIDFLKKHLM